MTVRVISLTSTSLQGCAGITVTKTSLLFLLYYHIISLHTRMSYLHT